jgi:subtilisin family serine protease
MNRLFAAALLAACGLLAGCAASPSRAPDMPARLENAAGRQVLMMRRELPRHYQPQDSYGGRYSAADRAAARRAAERIARDHGLSISDDWPMPALGLDCFVLEVPAKDSPQQVAERLAKDRRVESAQPMQIFSTLQAVDGSAAPLAQATAWRLSEIHARVTGKGVAIAEIDSGVDATHPNLAGRVAMQSNLVDARPNVAEPHGTAVAGILVASADNRLGMVGVATGARLIALRACWEKAGAGGTCSSFTLAKALQAALDSNVQVINMSLGGPGDTLLQRLIDVALARGMTVVAAYDERVAGGGFPASHPGVVAVGTAQDWRGNDNVWAAPGRDIPTTQPENRWDVVSGASFAAAHVSGLVALIRESTPAIDAQAMRQALGALPAGRASPTPEAPRAIEACVALQRASSGCFCACPSAPRTQSMRQ